MLSEIQSKVGIDFAYPIGKVVLREHPRSFSSTGTQSITEGVYVKL